MVAECNSSSFSIKVCSIHLKHCNTVNNGEPACIHHCVLEPCHHGLVGLVQEMGGSGVGLSAFHLCVLTPDTSPLQCF